MLSVVHRLGELEHIYDKHNVKLKTNGCITLSYPHSSSSAFFSNVQDLDALISSGTWIAGANRTWLHAELLFDDIAVSGASVPQTTEDFGVVLCNAEVLWSQLCLDASLTVNEPNKLLISLSAQSSSNASITTPGCIPSTCIEDIGMSFHFSTCRRTRNASRATFAVSGSDMQYDATPTITIDERLDSCHYSPLPSPRDLQDIQTHRHTSWKLGTSSVAKPRVSSHDSVSSNTHSTSSFITSTTRPTYATQEVKLETLLQMVDVSLRRMMSDYKPVRSGGIILSSDPGCPKLAGISPALFSPGYTKALWQRTWLLPTIAGTVSRVYRRTHSGRLRHKIGRLQEMSLSNGLDLGSTEGSSSTSVIFSSSVETQLWLLTRCKLIDPLACRSLKSLSISSRTGSRSYEMLDESVDSGRDVMLDGDKASTFEAYSDPMVLDAANHSGVSQEHSHFLDEVAVDGEELWDDDLFWDHSQDEAAHESVGNLDDDGDDSYARFGRASTFVSHR